jgi:hypothetical protein
MTPNAPSVHTMIARPLAFGGWEFTYAGPDFRHQLTWFQARPCPGAPVDGRTPRAARAAAEHFLEQLNGGRRDRT